MFCAKCGSQLSENALFCPNCGARSKLPVAAQNNAVVPVQRSANETNTSITYDRQDAYDELNRMFDYFVKQYDLYTECDKLETQAVPRPVRRFLLLRILLWYFAIAITVIPFVFMFIAPPNGIKEYAVAMLTILEYLSVAAFLWWLVIYIRRTPKRRAAKCAKYKAAAQEVRDRLFVYYQNYGPCQVGFNLTHPNTILMLITYINEGRASTIKEAINVLYTDIHRMKVEEQAKLTAQYSAEAARMARNAKITADGAAIMSAISFLNSFT